MVEISMAWVFKCFLIRARISSAALRVWVMQSIFLSVWCRRMCRALAPSVRVFPDPGPATTRQGPSVALTAAFCSGLSFSEVKTEVIGSKIVVFADQCLSAAAAFEKVDTSLKTRGESPRAVDVG